MSDNAVCATRLCNEVVKDEVRRPDILLQYYNIILTATDIEHKTLDIHITINIILCTSVVSVCNQFKPIHNISFWYNYIM